MRILHLCYSDLDGGAARAAFRLHQAQRSQGLDSHMLVINKCSDDPFVHTVSGLQQLRIKLASALSRLLLRGQKTPNPVHHSLNLFPQVCYVKLTAWPPMWSTCTGWGRDAVDRGDRSDSSTSGLDIARYVGL